MGHVYHIPCAGANSTPCPGRYVGETERTTSARFQEHTSTASNALGKYKSAMLQHARDHQHHFRKEDVTILSSEQDWVRRGIEEAIYIRALNPSINIDPGRHTLSTHFDDILSKVISAPPAPEPHKPETENLINTAPRRQGRPRKEVTIPKTITATQLPQLPSEQPQLQPQQQPSAITRPKSIIPNSQSQATRQSQRLLSRQQQQQQPSAADQRSSSTPPAAP